MRTRNAALDEALDRLVARLRGQLAECTPRQLALALKALADIGISGARLPAGTQTLAKAVASEFAPRLGRSRSEPPSHAGASPAPLRDAASENRSRAGPAVVRDAASAAEPITARDVANVLHALVIMKLDPGKALLAHAAAFIAAAGSGGNGGGGMLAKDACFVLRAWSALWPRHPLPPAALQVHHQPFFWWAPFQTLPQTLSCLMVALETKLAGLASSGGRKNLAASFSL